MTAGATALLMVDTMPPLLAPNAGTLGNEPYVRYQALAAWLNAYYARRHGYDLLYNQLSDEGFGCHHAVFGRRHPSYCKLPAIAAALRRYDTVVMLDSDTWFTPGALPLSELLAADERNHWSSLQQHSPFSPAPHVSPSVFFGSDRPFSSGPNCGFMVWRASAAAQELLRLWWHVDAGRFQQSHDYEQADCEIEPSETSLPTPPHR